MQISMLLDYLPLWGLFLATLVVVGAAVESGYWLGKYRRRITETEKETTVGPIVGATLGLLAFMLAFTFGLAASRFDARRQLVVEEANAIGTTYLRAGMLPEPRRSETRDLLRQYIEVRLEAARTGNLDQALTDTQALHDRLWAQAEAVSKEDPHSIVMGLFTQALNETIDTHGKRVQATRSRMPFVIWLVLYLVAMLSMGELGYHAGLTASRRSLTVAALILTFSFVLLLIMDLDRPREGLLRVSQQALIDLQNSVTPENDRVQSP